ncbi:MAG TPA: ribokinase [Spirochaetia bacterium]
MAGKVFVFGSINTDLVVYVQRAPQQGETVSGGVFATHPGGKGANQAVAAARIGAEVEMFGCLGDDTFGRERLRSLADTGISTAGVRLVQGVASGVAQITVDAEGENTIAVAPGANMKFSADGITLPRASPRRSLVSLLQNEIPQEASEKLVLLARAAGHVVMWNLAPTLSRRPSAEALRAVDYLICNRNELAALTGRPQSADEELSSVEEDARRALALGPGNLIVTLGRKGSFCLSSKGIERQEAFRVEAVDTVGAGDCFCGVLAAGIAEGRPVAEALLWASAAAAISTTRKGAQPSMPNRSEVEEFLRARQR